MKMIKHITLTLLGSITLFLSGAVSGADSISFTDKWQDSVVAGTVVSQDTGTLTATVTVPGLANLSEDQLGEITPTVNFGELQFSEPFIDANSHTTTSATFLDTETNNSGHEVTIASITFSRSGDVLTITANANNPITAQPPFSIIAQQYLGTNGPIKDQEPVTIGLSGALEYNLQKTVFITGTGSVTQSQSNTLDSVQVSGSVDYTAPKLTITAPKANQVWSNADFTVTGTAIDSFGISNVFVSLNNGGWTAAILSNGGSNWTTGVTLTPGTNTIAAYAVDDAGNLSTTDTVSFVYILSATLTVLTNGDGNVTPNDNGALLQIGKQYSLKAEPAKGFGLVNWTDGDGNVLTNGVTLTFIMASNLTFVANFKDITPPTITITAPKADQKWSNADFTVTGTAKDNVTVSNVFVSLNKGDWTAATLSDGGSNWSVGVTLTPGTNTIAAYALGTGDNLSTTDKVSIIYILSARLIVETNGDGSVSPDYNGDLLEIGASYSMKATAAKGFGFTYWSGSVPMTNDPTLKFTMASNLTIIANFKDVTPPVATITFPTAKQLWSNTVITVTGKASDNVGVASVWVQINGGDWTEAETANVFTNWSATNLTVVFGTNTVRAYAVDEAGNISPTNEVKFIGVVAPASLAGYEATLKPSVGKQELVVSWGDDTWAQVGADNDTNEDDYAAGSYTYMQTGPNTALLTNIDIGMLSALGTTNVATLNLTFTSDTSADYAWTNKDDSGTGTMTLAPVSNSVPDSLGGKTVQFYGSGGSVGPTINFTNNGTTFTQTKSGVVEAYGTYTFTQYSPTVAILELDFADPDEVGAISYVELTFTSATAGQLFYTYYLTPAYDGVPIVTRLGTFKIP
jgi:hypothetical protein